MSTARKLAIVYLIYMACGALAVVKFIGVVTAKVTEISIKGNYSTENEIPANQPLLIHLQPERPTDLAPNHLLVNVTIPSQGIASSLSLDRHDYSERPSIYAPKDALGSGFPHFGFQNPENHPIDYRISIGPDNQRSYRLRIIYNYFTDGMSASVDFIVSMLLWPTFASIIMVLPRRGQFQPQKSISKTHFYVIVSSSFFLCGMYTYNWIMQSVLSGFFDLLGGIIVVGASDLCFVIAWLMARKED